jgi:hypothetical protein
MIENNGWVKLHRQFQKWEWYQKSEMVHLFVHLLLSANHDDGKWQGQEVERGQLITGLLKLKQNTGISVRTLRTCMNRLKTTGEITIKTTNKYRIITIINYNDYQDDERKATSKPTSIATIKRQSNDNQTTTNNKDNKKENEKNIKQPSVAEDFNYDNKLKIMFSSKDERIPIIAYYWTIKGWRFEKDTYSAALKRELRAAGNLKGYTREKIKQVCEWLKANADFKWTLETCHKYIDEPLDKLGAGGKPQSEADFIKSLKEQYGKT